MFLVQKNHPMLVLRLKTQHPILESAHRLDHRYPIDQDQARYQKDRIQFPHQNPVQIQKKSLLRHQNHPRRQERLQNLALLQIQSPLQHHLDLKPLQSRCHRRIHRPHPPSFQYPFQEHAQTSNRSLMVTNRPVSLPYHQ